MRVVKSAPSACNTSDVMGPFLESRNSFAIVLKSTGVTLFFRNEQASGDDAGATVMLWEPEMVKRVRGWFCNRKIFSIPSQYPPSIKTSRLSAAAIKPFLVGMKTTIVPRVIVFGCFVSMPFGQLSQISPLGPAAIPALKTIMRTGAKIFTQGL